MARGRLLRIPCYQLIFFNGVIDILNVLVGSFIVAYIDFVSEHYNQKQEEKNIEMRCYRPDRCFAAASLLASLQDT